MPENRYHELLGLPQDVTDPDYYLLLGVDRSKIVQDEVEVRFKERMSRLQEIQSPKHKEFIEFLKGELKKARATLVDSSRRKQYDADLKNERVGELRKLTSHLLVDGTLSQMGETSLIGEGHRMGLVLEDIKVVIEAELERTGAQRVASKATDAGSQQASNAMMRELARALEEARIAARFAEARARHAEYARERAEEEAAEALQRVREAQNLIREAQSRETVRTLEAQTEKTQIEAQMVRLAQQLEERQREIEDLQAKLGTQAESLHEAAQSLQALAARGRRSERMVAAIVAALVAALAGHALRLYLPPVASILEGIGAWTARYGALLPMAVVGGIFAGLLGLLAKVAGRPGRAPVAILAAAMGLLGLVAGGAYLR